MTRFLQDSFWTLLAQITAAALQWALLSYWVRHSSLSAAGTYSLAIAVTAVVAAVAFLNMRLFLASDASNTRDVGAYVSCRVYIVLLLFPLLWVVMVHNAPSQANILLLVIGWKGAEAVTDVLHGELYRQRRARVASASVAARALAGIALIALCHWAEISPVLTLFGVAIISVLALCFDFVLVGSNCSWRLPSWSLALNLAGLAREAFPICFGAALGALTFNLPSFLLARYRGLDEVGVFTALNSFTVGFNIIAIAIGQAALPHWSRLVAKVDRRGMRAMVTISAITVGMGCGMGALLGAMFGPELLQFCFGPAVAAWHSVLPYLIISATPLCIAQVVSYLAMGVGARKSFLITPALSTVAGAVLGTALIPSFGLQGAVGTVAATGFIQALCFSAALVSRTSSVRHA